MATPSTEPSSRRGSGVKPDLPRVVITHDFMETYGGAERVTAEMARAFPDAKVVALLGRESVAERMGVVDRFESLLPPRPWFFRHYRELAPVLGALADHARVAEADVVLSSSYAFAHRLRSVNGAPRVCYCHSPLRFAWSMTDDYRKQRGSDPVSGAAFGAFAATMRRSDRRSAQTIHEYLTQSPYVADQIERFYGRDAESIGCPIDTSVFRPAADPVEDYYLFCGRLIEPYKQVGITIDAFRRLDARLVVAGDGPDRERLEAAAPSNVDFVGRLRDPELVPLMGRARALIFPSRDDFGMIPVEAMSCGTPVLAYAGGGSLYTSLPGVTGELFEAQTSEAIEAAVLAFDRDRYNSEAIRAHALQWDHVRFRERLIDHVRAAARV